MLFRSITSCTSRTVLGPRLQSTVRISNSASVGLGGSSDIYDDYTTMLIVRQEVGRTSFEANLNNARCRGVSLRLPSAISPVPSKSPASKPCKVSTLAICPLWGRLAACGGLVGRQRALARLFIPRCGRRRWIVHVSMMGVIRRLAAIRPTTPTT